ncbi:MAG TPA: carbohydrate-binding protein [Fibrobacteraceae bacterium]|nr:carbohydrate-binding protein [Fibrobacteraceae bacterium]
MRKNLFLSWLMVVSLALICFADNPILNYHYLADPTALVVGDELYIITDLDDESTGSSNYVIRAYYAVSTKDMVNWTDHGEIFRVPRDVSWASSAWAPAATWTNNKMFIYYPNGTGGIGVAYATSPVGPYTDPNGKAIITSSGLCDSTPWCFDPGVFVDDDGQGYLIYGGGQNTTTGILYGYNFRMVKLNSNMTSVASISAIRITGTTNSFEAPYITKYNNKYYLSFCNNPSNGQAIAYSTSTSPTSGYSYVGIFMANPTINGSNINSNGNHHQGLVEFNGNWYAAYHDRRVAIANGDSLTAVHRNISLDQLYYDTDGTFKSITYTSTGPTQIANFNPYDSVPATTGSKQQNIRSRTDTVYKSAPYSILTPKPKTGTSWERLTNVDFGTAGASKFTVNASSLNDNNKVEIRTDSATGTLSGTCTLTNTGAWKTYASTECTVSGLTGVVNYVYLVFIGTADSTAGLRWWRFTSASGSSTTTTSSSSTEPSSSASATPYSSNAVPGTLQAENYNLGGEGVGYHDTDATNSGGVYRTDGVDIDSIDEGYVVGWTIAGEWLEYTVNVAKTGAFKWEAKVASGSDSSSFHMLQDGTTNLTGTVSVTNTGSWTTYTTLNGITPTITKGEHVLRLVVDGSYVNIDWISFVDTSTVSVQPMLETFTAGAYDVYTVMGQVVGTIQFSSFEDMRKKVANLAPQPSVYLVKAQKGGFIYQVDVRK